MICIECSTEILSRCIYVYTYPFYIDRLNVATIYCDEEWAIRSRRAGASYKSPAAGAQEPEE
jgi:hypothetical protein